MLARSVGARCAGVDLRLRVVHRIAKSSVKVRLAAAVEVRARALRFQTVCASSGKPTTTIGAVEDEEGGCAMSNDGGVAQGGFLARSNQEEAAVVPPLAYQVTHAAREA